jgi:hypothetical protein
MRQSFDWKVCPYVIKVLQIWLMYLLLCKSFYEDRFAFVMIPIISLFFKVHFQSYIIILLFHMYY